MAKWTLKQRHTVRVVAVPTLHSSSSTAQCQGVQLCPRFGAYLACRAHQPRLPCLPAPSVPAVRGWHNSVGQRLLFGSSCLPNNKCQHAMWQGKGISVLHIQELQPLSGQGRSWLHPEAMQEFGLVFVFLFNCLLVVFLFVQRLTWAHYF